MIPRGIQKLRRLSRATSIDGLQVLHSHLIKTHLDHDEYTFNRLVLSAVSVSLRYARDLLDHSFVKPPPLFAWNTLIRAYSRSSVPGEAIKLFVDFLRTPGELRPDNYTYPFVIKACGRCSMIACGGSTHSMVLKAGYTCCLNVNNTLLTMYAACGDVGFSVQVFDEMRHTDVVSWSSLIAAYVDCGLNLDALRVFRDMKLARENPNSTTFVSLLAACTNLLDVRLGKCIHSHLLTTGLELHVGVCTALMRMYAKSGYLQEALCIFYSIPDKNLQCWTIMLSSLADHGCGQKALSLFHRMEEEGLLPDSMCLSAILSACSHTGLLHEGRELFNKMVDVYNIKPTMEHYGCIVDLLCRAGKIEEARETILSMSMEPNPVILRSYLNACKNHCPNIYPDEHLVQLLLKIEPGIGANYVLSANLSSAMGFIPGTDDIREQMKLKGLNKVPGCSLLS